MKNIKIKTKLLQLNDNRAVFELLPFQRRWLEDAKDKELTLTISDKKDRSLQQNAMLWALIHEIDKAQNGYSSDQGEEDIYLQLIEMANIEPQYIQCIPEAVGTLRGAYRVVREVEKRTKGDKESVVVKCYRGSSTFNTEEMSDFIEATLRYASELDLNLEEYKELRRNINE